jgi:hypothetical protein
MEAIGMLPSAAGDSLWNLGIRELTAKSLEASTREEVNEMLASDWILLHIYTLKYREGSTWRERPMAVLGRQFTS